jgi:membrane-associated PAP2 superfamily phosphatase
MVPFLFALLKAVYPGRNGSWNRIVVSQFPEYVLKKRLIELAAVAGFLLLATLVFWLTNADSYIASVVYGPNINSPVGLKFWPAGSEFPWNILYTWAPFPAIVLAVTALIVLVSGFFIRKVASCRRKTVFVLLLLALGPGLVVNVLLKDQLGRARPREVVEFGGSHEFTQFWQPGTTGRNSSFPSGHAAIAFFTIAPWFVLRDNKRAIATGFLVFGLSYGSLVGVARILQGGHFVSDVVWAGGLIYLIGGGLALVMGLGREAGENDAACAGFG